MGAFAKVKNNSFLGTNPMKNGEQPAIFYTRVNGTEIVHVEMVIEIPATGGTAFTTYVFALNPGLYATAPWLSGVAGSWDQYLVLGLAAFFISGYSDYSSSGPLGTNMMAFDYDCIEGAYPNEIELENAWGAVSAKPSCNMMMFAECDPRFTQFPIKNVRTGPIPANTDKRGYDFGNLVFATIGLPASSGVLGKLKISWHIMLYKPQLTLPPATIQDHFSLSTSISTSHYLGPDTTTVQLPTASSTLGGTAVNSTYTFPTTVRVGDIYQINYTVVGGSTSLTNAYGQTLTGCSAYKVLYADSTGQTYVAAAATSTTQIAISYVQITSTTATILFTSMTLPGSITGGDLWVTRMASTT